MDLYLKNDIQEYLKKQQREFIELSTYSLKSKNILQHNKCSTNNNKEIKFNNQNIIILAI